jgi:hypothetical protein
MKTKNKLTWRGSFEIMMIVAIFLLIIAIFLNGTYAEMKWYNRSSDNKATFWEAIVSDLEN